MEYCVDLLWQPKYRRYFAKKSDISNHGFKLPNGSVPRHKMNIYFSCDSQHLNNWTKFLTKRKHIECSTYHHSLDSLQELGKRTHPLPRDRKTYVNLPADWHGYCQELLRSFCQRKEYPANSRPMLEKEIYGLLLKLDHTKTPSIWYLEQFLCFSTFRPQAQMVSHHLFHKCSW